MDILFSHKSAPNPRRVLIFADELGIEDGVFVVKNIDMKNGQHKTKNFRTMNPLGQIPVLKTTDKYNNNIYISESIAICRYLEGKHISSKTAKNKSSLFGNTPLECAIVEMWNRRIELKLLMNGIGKVWINSPLLSGLAKKTGIKQSKSDRKMGQRISKSMFKMLEKELSRTQCPFIAGNFFSVADITLLCSIDFGIGLAGVKPYSSQEYPYLHAWHQRVSSRTSVMMHPNPYMQYNTKKKNFSKL